VRLDTAVSWEIGGRIVIGKVLLPPQDVGAGIAAVDEENKSD